MPCRPWLCNRFGYSRAHISPPNDNGPRSNQPTRQAPRQTIQSSVISTTTSHMRQIDPSLAHCIDESSDSRSHHRFNIFVFQCTETIGVVDDPLKQRRNHDVRGVYRAVDDHTLRNPVNIRPQQINISIPKIKFGNGFQRCKYINAFVNWQRPDRFIAHHYQRNTQIN
jgi:hypothetical protein